jgi:NAD+ synthase
MVALYYITNQLRYMVVGSSNRSEVAIGYFTKYGDGGVDIMPLGNLVKAQVKELARFLGIPQPIIDKPPSAGLWDGQTDESEMGISYEALDSFILTGEASDGVRKKIEKMMAGSAHKRSLPPIPEF